MLINYRQNIWFGSKFYSFQASCIGKTENLINFHQKEPEIGGKEGDECNEKDISEHKVYASAIYPSQPETQFSNSKTEPESTGINK